MKKFTLVALGISAALLAVTAIAKLLKKKCSSSKYDENEFDDWEEDYCFDDCNCDDSEIGSIIPPEDSEEVAEVPDVDVKVEEEVKETVADDTAAEKTEE